LLKKRTRNAKLAESRKKFIANRRKLAETRKVEYTKRSEAHYKRFQEEQTSLVNLRRKVPLDPQITEFLITCLG